MHLYSITMSCTPVVCGQCVHQITGLVNDSVVITHTYISKGFPLYINNNINLNQTLNKMTEVFWKKHFLKTNMIVFDSISLMFVLGHPIDNKWSLKQRMAWRRTGYRPLHEPVMTQFDHICEHHKHGIFEPAFGFKACISDYFHAKQWYIISHPCPNFTLFKPPLNLGHGWVIACHRKL